MSWKLMSKLPPHLGIGFDSNISSDRSRKSRIHAGSFFHIRNLPDDLSVDTFASLKHCFGFGVKIVFVDLADLLGGFCGDISCHRLSSILNRPVWFDLMVYSVLPTSVPSLPDHCLVLRVRLRIVLPDSIVAALV